MGHVVKLDGSDCAWFCKSELVSRVVHQQPGDARLVEESGSRGRSRQKSMDSIRSCNREEHSSTQNYHSSITNMLSPGLTISDTPKKNAKGKRIAKA